MGCNCEYKDSENRGKVWVLFSLASFKIPYLLYSFQLSVIKRFICYAFQYLSKTGSINRLRSLKTLYTKSTPVYDLRVCIAYTSCISLLCINEWIILQLFSADFFGNSFPEGIFYLLLEFSQKVHKTPTVVGENPLVCGSCMLSSLILNLNQTE